MLWMKRGELLLYYTNSIRVLDIPLHTITPLHLTPPSINPQFTTHHPTIPLLPSHLHPPTFFFLTTSPKHHQPSSANPSATHKHSCFIAHTHTLKQAAICHLPSSASYLLPLHPHLNPTRHTTQSSIQSVSTYTQPTIDHVLSANPRNPLAPYKSTTEKYVLFENLHSSVGFLLNSCSLSPV
jgi:hypothetical protein